MDNKPKRYVIHPAKFSLWLFIISVILFFGGLTSGYVVSKGIESDKGKWLDFHLPTILFYTTAVVVASSVTMQWAVSMARKNELGRAKIGLVLTIALGVFFLLGQVMAGSALYDVGVVWADSNSGSYVFIMVGLHMLHILMGLIALMVTFSRTQRNRFPNGIEVAYDNAATFWHFLGLLWVYLFIFLLINHQ